MNHFFKTFFACLLALFVGSIGFVMVSFIVLAGIIGTLASLVHSKSIGRVEPHTMPPIDLSHPLVDKPNASAIDLFDYNDFTFRDQLTLFEAATLIAKPSPVPRIDGLYLTKPLGIPPAFSSP